MDETDFGIPLPGQLQPRERWTRTGIDRLPLDGPFDWHTLFGRSAPVVLDIGCGNGRSTLTLALNQPGANFLGCDVLPLAVRHAIRRGNERGLANVRFAVADGRELLQRLVPPASVAEIHLYHPQPFYDLSKLHLRLLTPEFLVRLATALAPQGRLVIQTDNPGYWRYCQQLLPLAFDFQERHEPWPNAPSGISRREILARGKNLAIFRGEGRLREGLALSELRESAERLAPPVFSADRRLRAVDALE